MKLRFAFATIAVFASGHWSAHAADPVTQQSTAAPLTDCFYQGRRYSPNSWCTTSCNQNKFCSYQLCLQNGSWNPAANMCSWGINCPPKC